MTQPQILNSKPLPLVMGRHLIELGMKPSDRFKTILNAAYEAQLSGEFLNLEEGLEWVKNFLL